MTLTDRELAFNSEVFVFETVMRVRSTEIDVGQYLTIEALTALLTEAKARFLYSKGIKEINADYQGLMIDYLQIHVESRVRVREELLFEIGVEHLTDNDGNLAIKITRMYDGSVVAKARQHFVNYDYRLKKVVALNTMTKESLAPQPFVL